MTDTARTYLDFERPLAELDGKIDDLIALHDADGTVDVKAEIAQLRKKSDKQLASIYKKIGKFGDDDALQGGLGRLLGRPVVVMGHEKGNDTASRIKHNFGMANPEGYRKAVRLMDLAERFDLPVVSFVDTAGAYPGRGAEERGPILWRDAARAEDAAKAMKITATDLKDMRIVDEIIEEPVGGAHRDAALMIKTVGEQIDRKLDSLSTLTPEDLIAARRIKFLAIGPDTFTPQKNGLPNGRPFSFGRPF